MKKYWNYLQFLWKHKKYVYQEGRKLGLGRCQLLIHDLSKFRPTEFLPYANYFYGDRPELDKVQGDTQTPFDHAWLLHQHRNPHHYQHWILREDSGEVKLLPMPEKYRLEMIADWRGAGRALGSTNTSGWYLKNRDNIQLHPNTRELVEQELEVGASGQK